MNHFSLCIYRTSLLIGETHEEIENFSIIPVSVCRYHPNQPCFFYQKGNTTDGTVGSDSPDKENTLKPSASKGSDEFVNNADASEHSQSSHAEIDYSTYESTTLGISISYPAALQDIMAIAEGESYEGFISGQLNPITCIYLYPAEDTTYSQDSIIAQIYWLLAEEKGPEASYGQCVTLATAKDGSRCICHLPMNVKLQYQTVENYNLDLWNIYNTIEQSLLNGEFTATLLGNN